VALGPQWERWLVPAYRAPLCFNKTNVNSCVVTVIVALRYSQLELNTKQNIIAQLRPCAHSGPASNHQYTIVRSLYLSRLTVSFSTGTTTYTLPCASVARASLTHCTTIHQPSCYGLQLVAMSTIFCLFLFRIVVIRIVPTTRNSAVLICPGARCY